MVAVLPVWVDALICVMIGVAVGYQLCKFMKNPKAWLKDWFED